MKRKYKFFFHYNKPASLKAGKPQLTVHFKGVCHIVDRVCILTPTWSENRKQQPRCVICGKADNVSIFNGVATVL